MLARTLYHSVYMCTYRCIPHLTTFLSLSLSLTPGFMRHRSLSPGLLPWGPRQEPSPHTALTLSPFQTFCTLFTLPHNKHDTCTRTHARTHRPHTANAHRAHTHHTRTHHTHTHKHTPHTHTRHAHHTHTHTHTCTHTHLHGVRWQNFCVPSC